MAHHFYRLSAPAAGGFRPLRCAQNRPAAPERPSPRGHRS